MTSEKQAVGKKAIPMVPFLKLPKSPDEKAYLIGSRCRNCEEIYLGKKEICVKCYQMDALEEVPLSGIGTLFTYTIVHHSAPWVQVPYAAAIVKLREGPLVRASLKGIEPRPDALRVGMPLEMVTEKVREDNEGNDVIAYKFKSIDAG